jgi:Uma2 family endonuclease
MKVVKNFKDLDLNAKYTYADYLTWQFKERLELIKGYIFKMSPAPNLNHQTISRQISGFFWETLKNKNCKYFDAPFDVRLYSKNKNNEKVTTVVQPDICIVCDESKLDSAGCIGAPDLIVEILNAENTKKVMSIKYDLYEQYGVKEYWMVNPTLKTVFVYILENKKYIGLKPYTEDDTLKSTHFPKIKIKLNDVFN